MNLSLKIAHALLALIVIAAFLLMPIFTISSPIGSEVVPVTGLDLYKIFNEFNNMEALELAGGYIWIYLIFLAAPAIALLCSFAGRGVRQFSALLIYAPVLLGAIVIFSHAQIIRENADSLLSSLPVDSDAIVDQVFKSISENVDAGAGLITYCFIPIVMFILPFFGKSGR